MKKVKKPFSTFLGISPYISYTHPYNTQQENELMKLKTLILSGLTCLSLSACTSTPVIPQLTAGVLQEVKNIEVYPDTVKQRQTHKTY